MAPSRIIAGLQRTARFLNVLIVNFTVFVLVFLLLEFSARTYSLMTKGRSFFRPDTFTSCWITTYDYPPPKVGADGTLLFRNREAPTQCDKPANTVRIFAVGGSTTVNLVAYQEAGIDYPTEVERRLSRDVPELKFEVLNAGADAYSTAHSLVNIEFRLVEMNPDAILLMHNINDSSVNYFRDGASPDYSNKYLQSYFLNPNLQGTLSFTGFLTQSRFLSKFGLPQILADKKGDIHTGNDFSYGLRLFARNLVTIDAICKLNGIELILMSQPSTMEAHEFVSKAAFLAYNDETERIARGHSIRFIDMFTKMGHDTRYFIDQVHYSPEGVERFAEILAAELAPMVVELRDRGAAERGTSLTTGGDREE